MNKELIKILKKIAISKPKKITITTRVYEYVVTGKNFSFIYPFVFIYGAQYYYTGINQITNIKQSDNHTTLININDILELDFEF